MFSYCFAGTVNILNRFKGSLVLFKQRSIMKEMNTLLNGILIKSFVKMLFVLFKWMD